MQVRRQQDYVLWDLDRSLPLSFSTPLPPKTKALLLGITEIGQVNVDSVEASRRFYLVDNTSRMYCVVDLGVLQRLGSVSLCFKIKTIGELCPTQ